MSAKKCWRLFPYWTIDHKAAEVMLNTMAAEGWALHRVFFGLFARFRKAERTDLSYSVDLGDPAYKEDEEYLALCAECGWESVGYVRYMNLYASLPGASPTPIQTDGSVENERFHKVVLKRLRTTMCLMLALLLIVLLLLVAVRSSFYADSLSELLARSYIFSFLFFSAPAVLAGGLFYWLALFFRLRAWRMLTEEGSPIPVPEPTGVRLRCVAALLGFLLTLFLSFSAVLDFAVNQAMNPIAFGIMLLIAIPISLAIQKSETRRRYTPIYANAYLWFVGLGMVLSFLLPTLNPHPFQPAPVLPDGPIWGEEMKSVRFEGSYLGREDSWFESDNSLSFFVSRHSFRGEWMADNMWDSLLTGGGELVPGRTDILWAPDEDSPDICYRLRLRRGNDILYLYSHSGIPLDEFIAILDAWQAKSRTGP